MEERTWIHAFTDGRDVSPHAAVAGPRRAAGGPDRDRRRPLLRDGPRPALGADRARARRDRRRRAATPRSNPLEACASELRRGSHRRVRRADRLRGTGRASSAGDAVDLLQLPPRPRRASSRSSCSSAGVDLTTMTRYRDDFDCPGRLRRADRGRNTIAEVLAAHGARQLHAAETEKYAHVTYFFNGGARRSGRGRRASSSPRPRDVPSYDHKPEMSARRGRGAFCEEIGDGYRLRDHQLRQPGHGRPHRRDPRRRRGRRDRRHVPRRRRRGDATRAGGVCLVTADHGNAEQLLEPDGVSPHTAHTTNPVPLIAHRTR